MEKIYVFRIWVHSTVSKKMKPQLCFFFKKPSLVFLRKTAFTDNTGGGGVCESVTKADEQSKSKKKWQGP